MNGFIKYIITTIVISALCLGYHEYKVENLNLTIVTLESENVDLRNKIDLMEKNFENFIKKRNNNVKVVYKTKEKKITIPVVKQLEQVNKDIDELEKNMDSIKGILPNRKGQDLINSLKLKTDL